MNTSTLVASALTRLAGALDSAEAQLRASMAGSQLIGLALVRHVVKIEPLASALPQHSAPYSAPLYSTTSPET